MKSGNNGNQCVSVKKRLKIQYFRDFTEQKLLSYKLFGRHPIILQGGFVENSD
mgnify:FL=1